MRMDELIDSSERLRCQPKNQKHQECRNPATGPQTPRDRNNTGIQDQGDKGCLVSKSKITVVEEDEMRPEKIDLPKD